LKKYRLYRRLNKLETKKDKGVVLITRNKNRKKNKSHLYYMNYNGNWILEKERDSGKKEQKDD